MTSFRVGKNLRLTVTKEKPVMKTLENGDIPIVDVDVRVVEREGEEDAVHVHFVALTGFEGPQITIPVSLASDLRDKLNDLSL